MTPFQKKVLRRIADDRSPYAAGWRRSHTTMALRHLRDAGLIRAAEDEERSWVATDAGLGTLGPSERRGTDR